MLSSASLVSHDVISTAEALQPPAGVPTLLCIFLCRHCVPWASRATSLSLGVSLSVLLCKTGAHRKSLSGLGQHPARPSL